MGELEGAAVMNQGMTLGHWLALLAIVVAIIVPIMLAAPHFLNQSTRTKIVQWVKEEKGLAAYHDVLNGLLGRVEYFYGPAHSYNAFMVCLLLALLYPILFFIASYSFGGANVLAGIEVFPAKNPYRAVYLPAFVIGFLVMVTVAFLVRI